MKYHLRYRAGNYNLKTGKFEKEWDYEIEAETVYSCTNIHFGYVSTFDSKTIDISLNAIPARIDLMNNSDVWLHDDNFIKYRPEPYKSTDVNESHIVWERDKVEEVKSPC